MKLTVFFGWAPPLYEPPGDQDTGTPPGHQDTGIQDTRTLGHRDTAHWNPGTPGGQYTRTPGHWDTWTMGWVQVPSYWKHIVIFNERKLVLELLNVVKVKVKVKVTMKKFRDRFLLPESLDDL